VRGPESGPGKRGVKRGRDLVRARKQNQQREERRGEVVGWGRNIPACGRMVVLLTIQFSG